MIEREVEVVNRIIDESSDIAIELANLRDSVEGTAAEQVKPTLDTLVDRVNALADVLTALSIDLTRVNNNLGQGKHKEGS